MVWINGRNIVTRLHLHDDRLSRAATILVKARRELIEAADEVELLHAPAECFRVIVDALDDKLEQRLGELGFNEGSLMAAVAERTTDRFAFQLFSVM